MCHYSGILVDVDGVVLYGGEVIPEARSALEMLRDAGIPIVFITNNVTTPREIMLGRLRDASGLPEPLIVDPIDVFNALEVTNSGEEWLVVGSDNLVRRLREAGILVLERFAGNNVAGILVSSVISLDYSALVEAVRLLHLGVRGLATGLDRVFHWREMSWPGVGALVAFLEYAGGKKIEPLGKPSPTIFHLARKRLVAGGKVLVVGDDLLMDIEPASRAGFDTALVFSGVTRGIDPQGSGIMPSFTGENLLSIANRLRIKKT